MFNWKPHMHSGWQWGRHDGHFLSPRNIAVDAALVFAAVMIIFTAWRVVPPRIAAAVESLRAATSPDGDVQDGALAVTPPTANLDSNALVEMTYDRSADYRVDAVTSLAERGEIRALLRIQELQVVDGNDNVQQAAYKAEDQFRAHIATELYLPMTEIRYVVATESGDAYAVSNDSLYALRDGKWQFINQLPDAPNGIATTPDRQTIYLATNMTGLWRSNDSGATWKRIQFGIDTPTQLTVTAVTINPEHSWQIFVALAAPGADGQKNPLGVFVSSDDGASWRLLPNSPINAVTTRLVIHLPWTGFLYGVADEIPWRYTLPLEAM
jgi:hypothetical protein